MDRETPKLLRGPSREVRSQVFDSSAWDNFPVRGDDVVIATYPKCGTTWMQRIVSSLILQSAEPIPVQESSPWPDMRVFSLDETIELANSQVHRRYLKTHLPYDALPVHEGVKFIHVARDGRDTAMSFYNHKIVMTDQVIQDFAKVVEQDPKFNGTETVLPIKHDPAEHFHNWVHGLQDHQGDEAAGFFNIENSFWAARHEPNVLLVHFADLKTDRDGEMRRIADFLDIDTPDALWPDLVEAAGFDAMKSKSSELMPHADMLFNGGGNSFLHKGTNGRWEGVVHPEDLGRYDAKVKAEFSPALANWVANGRLVAGDPRASED